MKTSKKNLVYILLLSSISVIFILNIYLNSYYIDDKLRAILLYNNSTKSYIKQIEILNREAKCNPFILNPVDNRIDLGTGQLYPKQVPLYFNNSFNFTCLNNPNRSYLILFWTKFFGYGMMQSMNKCPVNNCKLTEDKQQANKSNVIIFHLRNKIVELPKYRSLEQLWLFFLLESTSHSDDYTRFNNLFNLSATYKSSSDFASEYLRDFKYLISNDATGNELNKTFLLNKSEFAAAIISNCNDKSHRLEYINELKKYIPVKVFGKCGVPCPNNNINCKEFISSKTKFFLSFENSLCKDYVTEKFFDILNYNIIPVVYGYGNYDHYVPKNAFINAREYESPKELAHYLNYLNKNTTAYLEYFKWKKYLKKKPFDPGDFRFLCDLCIKLNLDYYLKPKPKWIKDFGTFWNKSLDCL